MSHDATNPVPHLSEGIWVARRALTTPLPRLQRGQAVKVRSEINILKGKIGIFVGMRNEELEIQFGDELWLISPKSIREYQEMTYPKKGYKTIG